MQNTLFYILQVDQQKAFISKINHGILYKTMDKMGFADTFMNLIKTLFKNNTCMKKACFFFSPVYLEKGLRQGCLPSLPLCKTQRELTKEIKIKKKAYKESKSQKKQINKYVTIGE